MKTIEQEGFNITIAETTSDDVLIQRSHVNCSESIDSIFINSENRDAFIQALLPKGKAVIEVPEGYEVTDTEQVNLHGMSKLVLYLSKLPEPFKWPEHLPDGTRLEQTIVGKGWNLAIPYKADYFHYVCIGVWNEVLFPNDRIEIPDWLEKEPRTIVKGE